MKTENYQTRFWAVVRSKLGDTFTWGKFDCATFAIECIAAVREDSSFIEQMRERFGQWDSALTGTRAHTNALAKATEEILGSPTAAAYLGMCDVAIAVDDQGRELLCVHDGAGFICPSEGLGFKRLPFRMIQHGWVI